MNEKGMISEENRANLKPEKESIESANFVFFLKSIRGYLNYLVSWCCVVVEHTLTGFRSKWILIFNKLLGLSLV